MKKFKIIIPTWSIFNLSTLLVAIMVVLTSCKKEDEDDDVVPALNISSVTVTPETSEVPKGFSLDLTATVNGDNLAETDKTVTWKVTGNDDQETVIHADGVLIIAEDETAETLIITATSIVDESKSGTATITVFEYQNSFYNNFDNAEIVEIEFMGEIISCYYVDGSYIIEHDIVIKEDNYENDILTKAANVQDDNFGRLWPQGKVYYFRGDSHSGIASSIESAMNEIEAATNGNIKFIELKTNEARNYTKNTQIRIIYDADRSQSYVGMTKTKFDFQNLWLKKPENALHEICHALGLIHEHSRPDRDKYIIVHKDRVQDDKGNFDKVEYNNNYAISSGMMLYYDDFDFLSVMMYDSYHRWVYSNVPPFKILYAITDLKDNPLPNHNTDKLSSIDKKVLNKMYSKRDATADVFIHSDNVAPTSNSCILKGELIYEGYPARTECGIYYRESSSVASFPYQYQTATNNDDGKYWVQLSGLKPNTTYEAGAYVKTQNGQYEQSPQVPITFKTLQETSSSSTYIDFGDDKYVRIYLLTNPAEYLYEDGSSSNSYNTKGITYLGSYNRYQFPNIKDVFKLKKVGVSGDKILYTIYSEGEGNGLGGGGYLTDATHMAFNSNGTHKNPDYIYQTSWARLSFEKTQSSNSSFAFRRIERGSTDFVIETASGDSNAGSYIKIQNAVPVISRITINNISSGASFFGLIEVQR